MQIGDLSWAKLFNNANSKKVVHHKSKEKEDASKTPEKKTEVYGESQKDIQAEIVALQKQIHEANTQTNGKRDIDPSLLPDTLKDVKAEMESKIEELTFKKHNKEDELTEISGGGVAPVPTNPNGNQAESCTKILEELNTPDSRIGFNSPQVALEREQHKLELIKRLQNSDAPDDVKKEWMEKAVDIQKHIEDLKHQIANDDPGVCY